jgi:(heptosyl)LPS beta-1,4-glucosyltransferase
VGSPVAAFLSSYFLKAGFLDGFQGLLISAFAAYYNFLKYSKLWDLQRSLPPGKAAGDESLAERGRTPRELTGRN